MLACWHVGMLALTLVDNFTCLTILLVWQFYLFDNFTCLTIILFDNYSFRQLFSLTIVHVSQLYMSDNCTCLTIILFDNYTWTIIHVWQLSNNLQARGVRQDRPEMLATTWKDVPRLFGARGSIKNTETPLPPLPGTPSRARQSILDRQNPARWVNDEYLSSSITQPAVLPRQGAWVIHEALVLL